MLLPINMIFPWRALSRHQSTTCLSSLSRSPRLLCVDSVLVLLHCRRRSAARAPSLSPSNAFLMPIGCFSCSRWCSPRTSSAIVCLRGRFAATSVKAFLPPRTLSRCITSAVHIAPPSMECRRPRRRCQPATSCRWRARPRPLQVVAGRAMRPSQRPPWPGRNSCCAASKRERSPLW